VNAMSASSIPGGDREQWLEELTISQGSSLTSHLSPSPRSFLETRGRRISVPANIQIRGQRKGDRVQRGYRSREKVSDSLTGRSLGVAPLRAQEHPCPPWSLHLPSIPSSIPPGVTRHQCRQCFYAYVQLASIVVSNADAIFISVSLVFCA